MHEDKARQNRAEAVTNGDARFHGLACKMNIAHAVNSGSWRYTSNGRCCECEKERVYAFRAHQARNS